MTQDNKIWHSKRMHPTPKDAVILVQLTKDWMRKMIIPSTRAKYVAHRADIIKWEAVARWAYVDDLIASSKALDVAIEALKNIQWFCYAPTLGERAGRMQQCADKTLKQVNEIMKSLQ